MNQWKALLAYFAAKGLPEEFVRHVCISEEDAELLAWRVRHRRCPRILEIGTFIGLSTGIIACSAEEDASLVCVDPNLPVSMHRFIGSGVVHHADDTRALKHVADMLESFRPTIRHTLLEGTFSTPLSEESVKEVADHGWPIRSLPVVGGTLSTHAPFNVIFLDGDHSASAVECDLCLACSYLASDGEILLHDVGADWGCGVRAGVSRFLAGRPGFDFTLFGNNFGMVRRRQHHDNPWS